MKIAVVILNWNGKKLLEQFLPSVVTNSNKATIYLVDNASTDASVAYVANTFPDIRIIQNNENGGYAKGYNDALKYIEADVYCLLNNDVEVSDGWLKPLVAILNNEQKTAIVQPKILDFKHKNRFEYAGAAGGFVDKYGYPYCRGRILSTVEKDMGQYDDEAEIFWASGACFFIRSAVFKKLGGFDESYFAHMEEIDLCWRAKNSGYSVKYVSGSEVYHLGGATLSNQNPQKTYLNFRNSLLTLVKNAKGTIFSTLFIRLILDGLAAIFFLIQLRPGHFFAIIKAHIHFYGKMRHVLNQRKLQMSKVNYYEISSIVKAYYVNDKKTFKEL